ncbi:hypothetical protein [Nocardia cyriacigeorgica]|uniref:hypothetical protein n=1 Tax=Nocardia cyriacigeorgica TaxID=135487 RepID=UPI0013D42F63|nr:hypothetical protein [Nocardia cyriacigeorgica]NEW29488.1 hypothetical protein [Nocardia cyriacigeorgica]
MSSVFAVLPAAGTDSPEQAFGQYRAILDRPESTAPLPVVGIVAAQLRRRPAPLTILQPPDGRGLLLRAGSGDLLTDLCAALRLTATRDLAVFEVDARRLHHPRAAARVPVKAGPHAFPTVTEPLVDLLIPERRSLDDPALTLARNHDVQLRIRQLPDGILELTHRTGGLHFRLLTDDAPLARKVTWSWARRDGWWQEAISWQPCEPSNDQMPVTDDAAALLAELDVLRAEVDDLEALDAGAAMHQLDELTRSVLDIEIPTFDD